MSDIHGISKTSIYVAAARALGAREPDAAIRNPDHLAEALLGDPSQLALENTVVQALSLPYQDAIQQIEVVNIVRAMLVRTRFIDDALRKAVSEGAAQVVILGAGFDSHAYRFAELLAHVRVFEVDRPATQALKRRRVAEVVGPTPLNLAYVPVDFDRETLPEALARHGHDPAQQTFFVMEGVTMYLPESAVRRTLAFIASHPRGSAVVFDFVYRPMIDSISQTNVAALPESARRYMQQFLDLIKDEPWVFGMQVGGEREFLASLNLALREIIQIGGEESLARYATKADGTQLGAATVAAAIARFTAEQQAAVAANAARPMPSPEQMRERQRLMAYQLVEAVVP